MDGEALLRKLLQAEGGYVHVGEVLGDGEPKSGVVLATVDVHVELTEEEGRFLLSLQ